MITLEMHVARVLIPEGPSEKDDGSGYDERDELASGEPRVFEEKNCSGEPGNENP